MKKQQLFMMALALVSMIISQESLAQRGPGGGQGRMQMSASDIAERQTKWMNDILDLTEKQLVKVEEINMKFAEKMMAERQSAMGDREAMRSLMIKLTKEKDEELKKVLTEDQLALLQKKRREAMQNRKHSGMGGGS